MRHLTFTLLSTVILMSLAPAQDLKMIKRHTGEIQMFASSACLGDDNQPLADTGLNGDDQKGLAASEKNLLTQLTTLKAQAATLAQLGMGATDTKMLDAKIAALSGSASLCVKAQNLSTSANPSSASVTASVPATLTLSQATSQVKNLQPLACQGDSADASVKSYKDQLATAVNALKKQLTGLSSQSATLAGEGFTEQNTKQIGDELAALGKSDACDAAKSFTALTPAGTGSVTAPAALTPTPVEVLFAKAEVGGSTTTSSTGEATSTFSSQTITLKSSGGDLHYQQVQLCDREGRNCDPHRSKEFALTKVEDCSGAITSSSACKLTIEFRPYYAGDSQSVVWIDYTDSNGVSQPQLGVPLFGTGFVANIAELNGDGAPGGNPAFRSVAGLNLAGAASGDVKQNYFLEFDLNAPIGPAGKYCQQLEGGKIEPGKEPKFIEHTERKVYFGGCRSNEAINAKPTDPLNRRWWWFFNPRLTSVPQQPTSLAGLNLQGVSDLFTGQKTNLVQGVEVTGGVEWLFLKPRNGVPFWSSYKNVHPRIGMALVAGAGIQSPFSASSQNPPVFALDATNSTLLNQLTTIGLPASECTSTDGKGTCNHANFAFVDKDRSRFFRQYFAGLRLKTYYFSDRVRGKYCDPGSDEPSKCEGVYNAFPGIIDLTVGQNESITGGQLRHWVFRMDAVYPLPFFPGLTIFGGVNAALERNKTSDPFFPPSVVSGVTVSDKSVLTIHRSLPDRDTFHVGIGFDLVQLVHQISSKNKSGSNAAAPAAATTSGSGDSAVPTSPATAKAADKTPQ